MIRRYNKKRRTNGFTVVELIFVVLILSLLAAITIPQFVAYRARAYSSSANVAVRQAYIAAESYFGDNPGAMVSVNDLSVYGYNPHVSIALTIGSLHLITNFTIQAIHTGGGSTFTVDQSGAITRS